MTKLTIHSPEHHQHGWGYEQWTDNLPEYCGKLLRFEGGKKTSLHYHINKLETMYLAEGEMFIDLIEPEKGEKYRLRLDVGDCIRIPRGHAHQLIAIEDSVLFEFSTHHEESDSYRIEKGD